MSPITYIVIFCIFSYGMPLYAIFAEANDRPFFRNGCMVYGLVMNEKTGGESERNSLWERNCFYVLFFNKKL